VDPVALRLDLPEERALKRAGVFLVVRMIPSPDAALGDGNVRSAAIATTIAEFALLLY